MNDRSIKGILINICIAFTILSLASVILNIVIYGQLTRGEFNTLNMLLWTSIAVGTLSIYNYFEDWSTGAVIIMQYVIAMTLVLLSIFVLSLFEEVHPNGYRDAFITFTIPYIIGAIVFYIDVFKSAKRQNQHIQFIRSKIKCDKSE